MTRVVPVRDIFETNAYFHVDPATGAGFLVDPGAEAERLLRIAAERGWTIERILLTHAHFDHTGAVAAIARAWSVPYAIHRADIPMLADPALNLSAPCGRLVSLADAEPLRDGDEIRLAANPGFGLRVLHTPGHSPGSCTFLSSDEGIAFVGDTIFRGGPGTDEYPGGDGRALARSILGRLLLLPPETRLLSGHSAPTTVAEEAPRYARR
ncbi:MAG: MBL fold metallo-hydrolase [Kiritimatiellae bacterium]|nr:MBL fold metallo-hydrolase [Kiritimatiellia bacterium]